MNDKEPGPLLQIKPEGKKISIPTKMFLSLEVEDSKTKAKTRPQSSEKVRNFVGDSAK